MVSAYLGSYFNAVNDLKNYSTNSYWTTTKAIIKLASYVTIIAPLIVGTLYGVSSLVDRVVYGSNSPTTTKTDAVAAKVLQSQEGTKTQVATEETSSNKASNSPLSDTEDSQGASTQEPEDRNHSAANQQLPSGDVRSIIKMLTGQSDTEDSQGASTQEHVIDPYDAAANQQLPSGDARSVIKVLTGQSDTEDSQKPQINPHDRAGWQRASRSDSRSIIKSMTGVLGGIKQLPEGLSIKVKFFGLKPENFSMAYNKRGDLVEVILFKIKESLSSEQCEELERSGFKFSKKYLIIKALKQGRRPELTSEDNNFTLTVKNAKGYTAVITGYAPKGSLEIYSVTITKTQTN